MVEIIPNKGLNEFTEKFNMHSTDDGLTVGELTMTISALIIVGLVWSTFSQKKNSDQSFQGPANIERIGNFI